MSVYPKKELKTLSYRGNNYLLLNGPTRTKPDVEIFAATGKWIDNGKAIGPRLRFLWYSIDPRPRAQCGGPPPEPEIVSPLPPRYVRPGMFNLRKEKRRFDWIKVLDYRLPGAHAQYHPAYNAECAACQATGFALEPGTLLCESCAKKRISFLCERCGNFIQRDEHFCICHERLTGDAVYIGEGYHGRPLFQSNLGVLYVLLAHPYGNLDLEIRLANAGLRTVMLAEHEGMFRGEAVTNTLLRKEMI